MRAVGELAAVCVKGKRLAPRLLMALMQCCPEVPAAGDFAGYWVLCRRLLFVFLFFFFFFSVFFVFLFFLDFVGLLHFPQVFFLSKPQKPVLNKKKPFYYLANNDTQNKYFKNGIKIYDRFRSPCNKTEIDSLMFLTSSTMHCVCPAMGINPGGNGHYFLMGGKRYIKFPPMSPLKIGLTLHHRASEMQKKLWIKQTISQNAPQSSL